MQITKKEMLEDITKMLMVISSLTSKDTFGKKLYEEWKNKYGELKMETKTYEQIKFNDLNLFLKVAAVGGFISITIFTFSFIVGVLQAVMQI